MILGATGSFKGSVATFAVTAPGAGIVEATVTAAGKARKASASASRRAKVRGKVTKGVAEAGKVALKIKLKGKAARRLERKKSFRVKLATVFTPIGGSAQPKVTRTVTLKRRKK